MCMYRYIVFDLDETICFLSQFYVLYRTFENHNEISMDQHTFTTLLDKLPCIFRPGIFVLLAYIKVLRERACFSLVLYTNSTLPQRWIHFLTTHIEKKCHCDKLFDHVISLHTTGRNTTDKTVDDILKYCKHSGTSYSFFVVDDRKHKHLIHDNIQYNLVTSYKYYYPNNVIWSALYDVYCIRRSHNIIQNNVDEKKNTQILTVCKQETIKLFPFVHDFLCSSLL